MEDVLASTPEIAAALGVRAKRINELSAKLHFPTGINERLSTAAFAKALAGMEPEHQHQLRAVQRPDLAHMQFAQLAHLAPKPFVPAAGAQAKAAEGSPLTSPVRTRASWAELARYWGVPTGEVQRLVQTLGLKVFKAQEGVEPMCNVVDLERKQAASTRFNQQLTAAKKRDATLQEKIRQREETMAKRRAEQDVERERTAHIRGRVHVRGQDLRCAGSTLCRLRGRGCFW
jgi:hypothetical protein